ncbi:MAG: hypothetical protein K7J47_20960, partial [Acidobacteria bacterium]|nr:hypothetical protein [Bryobacteraceae bacterium CoA2 C42]
RWTHLALGIEHPENRVVLVDIASDPIEILHGCSASFALSWGYRIAPTQSRALIRSQGKKMMLIPNIPNS